MKNILRTILAIALFIPSLTLAVNITVPQSTAFGDVLRGNVNGTYTPVATSTLGITGSGTVTTITAGTNITLSSGATCTTTCTINATGGGTNFFTNSGNNTYLNFGLNLQAPTFEATSTSKSIFPYASTTALTVGTFLNFLGYSSSAQLYAGDPQTGLHFDGPGIISFHNSNVQTLLLSSINNVGIASSSPGQKLSVGGDILGNNIIGARFHATSSIASSLPYASSTAFTTTNAFITKISNLTSNGLIKTAGSDGTISTATNGTDYTLISATSCSAGQHVSVISASGAVTCSADTGSGGGAYPFTPATNYAVNNQATTGIIWAQNGINATSTSHFDNASTTLLTATTAYITNLANLATGFVKVTNGLLSVDTNTYLTGNQSITLSGDVSGSGSTAITTAIGTNKVTVGMLAQAGANTILGNPKGATANVQYFSTSTLGVAISDTTGTLLIPRGGTGQTSFTSNQLHYGNFSTVGTTTLTGTAPITFSQPISVIGSTPSVVTCATASGSVTGCLTSTDWTTFNNKQPAGNYLIVSPFTASTNYNATNQATTGIVWFQNGLNASSTSHLSYASTTAFTADTICLTADSCRTTWPTSGGGGGTYPFTPTLNYAVNNQATTGIAWFQNGFNASSTSHVVSTTFDINGSVGIGITTPTAGLHVLSGQPYISKFQSTGADNFNQFVSTSGTGEYGIWNDSLYFQSLDSLSNGIRFYGSSSNRIDLQITSAGSVGIGTSTPYRSLSVADGAVFGSDVRSSYYTATSSTASRFPFASTTAISNINGEVLSIPATFIVSTSTNTGNYTDIQTAINNLPSNGGKIFVRAGTYTITSPILIKVANTVIEGEGPATQINFNGGSVANAIVWNGTGITNTSLRDFYIHNTSGSYQGIGINASNTPLVYASRIKIDKTSTSTSLKDTVNQTFYSSYEDLDLRDNKTCIDMGGTNPVNDKLFINTRCAPTAGQNGFALYSSTSGNGSQNNTFINFNSEPTGAGTGITAIYLNNAINTTFVNPYVEGNAIGYSFTATTQRTNFVGGLFLTNTTYTDSSSAVNFQNVGKEGVNVNQLAASTSIQDTTGNDATTNSLSLRYNTNFAKTGNGIDINFLNSTDSGSPLRIINPGTGASIQVDSGNVRIGTTTGNTALVVNGTITSTSTAPTLSSCGTSPSRIGNNNYGEVTAGATATGCTVTFATSFPSFASCTVTPQTGSITNTFSYTVSKTAIVVTETGLGGTKFNYSCGGY